jgi:hypothetical protein
MIWNEVVDNMVAFERCVTVLYANSPPLAVEVNVLPACIGSQFAFNQKRFSNFI